jgi:hypothetical protein
MSPALPSATVVVSMNVVPVFTHLAGLFMVTLEAV